MTTHTPIRRSSGLSLAIHTAVVLAVFTVPAAAQTRSARDPSFSLVAGLNFADLSLPLPALTDDIDVNLNTDARRGFIGGVLAELPFNARVSFDTGALVSVRGARVAASVPGFGRVDRAILVGGNEARR